MTAIGEAAKSMERRSPYAPLNVANYEEIARAAGLNPRDTKRYVLFMQRRLPGEFDAHYAGEWADRFERGVEYDKSDLAGERILLKIYREVR